MICKNCNQEILDTENICPHCGAELEAEIPEEVTAAEVVEEPVSEETAQEITEEQAPEEKPKAKVWKWVALGVGCILLLGVLVLAILYGLGVDLKPKANDISIKTVYTVDSETAAGKKDKVVATMGGKELTNGELQLYYQNLIYTFYNEYYYYMSYMGVDFSLPLSQQECGMAAGQTWEQYFLQGAIDNWQSYTLVEILAENENFQASEDLLASLGGITEELTMYAESEGYEDLDAYIDEGIGANVDLEDYLHFNEVYYISNEYLDGIYEASYPNADEIEAYFTQNEATMTANGITRDMGLLSNVRHILVSVEGGTENEDGTVTYSEEEWNTALTEAERILQEWKDGAATEESFAELATTYTDDPGSAATGGLYTDICIESSYVENFLNWSIDAARVPGETGIVQTDYGYHIMYFVDGEDYWSFLVAEQVIADVIREKLILAKAEYPIETNYKNIFLAEADIVG